MLVAEFSPLGRFVDVGFFFLETSLFRFSSLRGIHVKVEIVSVGDLNS